MTPADEAREREAAEQAAREHWEEVDWSMPENLGATAVQRAFFRFGWLARAAIAQAEVASLRAERDDFRARLATQCGETLAARAERDALLAAEPVAWRHSHTLCLYDSEHEVQLADGDEWAEPLYLAAARPPQPPAEGGESGKC